MDNSVVSADAWLTLAVVVVTVAILGSERIPAPPTVLGAVTFLLVSGVRTTEQALSSFSNPAPIAVAALYVLAANAEASGVLERVAGWSLPSRPAEWNSGARRAPFGSWRPPQRPPPS